MKKIQIELTEKEADIAVHSLNEHKRVLDECLSDSGLAGNEIREGWIENVNTVDSINSKIEKDG